MGLFSGNPQYVAGEAGVTLNIQVNQTPLPSFPVFINTATSILLLLQYPDLFTTTQLTMTSSVDGLTALRTTLATDFPMPGNYNIELQATYPDGSILKSAPQIFVVAGFC